MKKSCIWIAFSYAIAGLIGGVFYREFTKVFTYVDRNTLGFLHVHLLVMGMIMFLVISLFNEKLHLDRTKLWKPFLIVYNIGLPFTVSMLIVRGVMQVIGYDGGAVVSGIAGVAHIILGAGIILFFIMLLLTVGKGSKKRGSFENNETNVL